SVSLALSWPTIPFKTRLDVSRDTLTMYPLDSKCSRRSSLAADRNSEFVATRLSAVRMPKTYSGFRSKSFGSKSETPSWTHSVGGPETVVLLNSAYMARHIFTRARQSTQI